MDTSPLSGLRFTNILAPSVTGLPIVLPAPFKEQKSLILILLDLPCFLLQIMLLVSGPGTLCLTVHKKLENNVKSQKESEKRDKTSD